MIATTTTTTHLAHASGANVRKVPLQQTTTEARSDARRTTHDAHEQKTAMTQAMDDAVRIRQSLR